MDQINYKSDMIIRLRKESKKQKRSMTALIDLALEKLFKAKAEKW